MTNTRAETAFLQADGSSSGVIHRRASSELARRIGNANGPRILDLGCGKGDFLRKLKSEGRDNLHGCDGWRFPEAELSGFDFTLADLNKRLPYADAEFDAVTTIEVVEHLENPRAFLREAYRVLKPGGTLVLTTPNNESLTSLISLFLRGYYSAFAPACYPAHITPLLEIDLRRILKECDFGEVAIGWTNDGRIPATEVRWRSLLGPFARGKRFSDNLVLTAKREN